MSSSDQVIFIQVHNTLKRRTQRSGGGLTVEEMQQAASAVVEAHTASLTDQLQADIAASRKTIEAWRPGLNCAELVSKLSLMASKCEEQGRVFGNRLLTEVGIRLGQFMTHFSTAVSASAPSAKAMIAITLHLDAMIVALDGRASSDAIDEIGQVLLSNLELTHRTIR